MIPKKLQVRITQLPKESRVLIELVNSLYSAEIDQLKARIKQLEDQIAKNSSNSSKPPSSDEYNKKPKSSKPKTDKKPGGQKGHKGSTLNVSAKVDRIENHQVQCCQNCNKDLSGQQAERIEHRQEFEIPPMKMEVIQHQSEVKTCTCGCVNKAFPEGVNHPVQYGSNFKSLMVYLQDYQLLPYARTKELVKDLFGHAISTGSLYNFRKYSFDKLASFEEKLKKLLTVCVVAGFDETGLRVMAKRLWLHSCSTDKHAYYQVDEKRGSEAMDRIGILPDFKGVAIHDYWKSYYKYECEHGLCNAHLLRDLIFIEERFEQDWARQMIDLLLKMLSAKNKAIAKGRTKLSPSTLKRYQKRYDEIVRNGLKINPFKPPAKKTRGKPKKTPPLNLLERLQSRTADILRFLYDFKVCFDNNFSERDIRMMKVKQKISGCFRSLKGAQYFARVRSYIMTARKQQVNTFVALKSLFTYNAIVEMLTA